jgi:hypothetical protein
MLHAVSSNNINLCSALTVRKLRHCNGAAVPWLISHPHHRLRMPPLSMVSSLLVAVRKIYIYIIFPFRFTFLESSVPMRPPHRVISLTVAGEKLCISPSFLLRNVLAPSESDTHKNQLKDVKWMYTLPRVAKATRIGGQNQARAAKINTNCQNWNCNSSSRRLTHATASQAKGNVE